MMTVLFVIKGMLLISGLRKHKEHKNVLKEFNISLT